MWFTIAGRIIEPFHLALHMGLITCLIFTSGHFHIRNVRKYLGKLEYGNINYENTLPIQFIKWGSRINKPTSCPDYLDPLLWKTCFSYVCIPWNVQPLVYWLLSAVCHYGDFSYTCAEWGDVCAFSQNNIQTHTRQFLSGQHYDCHCAISQLTQWALWMHQLLPLTS